MQLVLATFIATVALLTSAAPLVLAMAPADQASSPAAIVASRLETPLTSIVAVSDLDSSTDPDGLLGYSYTSKAAFQDSAGFTGYVEVFRTAAQARTRASALAGGPETDLVSGQVVVCLMGTID